MLPQKILATRFDPASNPAPAATANSPEQTQAAGSPKGQKNSLFHTIQESQAQFEARHVADRLARQRMSAVKRFSPLILAMIKRPGTDAQAGEISETLRVLMNQSFRIADQFLSDIAPDDVSPFMKEQAVGAVSDFVATEWVLSGRVDSVADSVLAVTRLLPDVSDLSSGVKEGRNELDINSDKERQASIYMSATKSLQPLFATLMDYDVASESVFLPLCDQLFNRAEVFLKTLDSDISHVSRLQSLQNHLVASGKIMTVSVEKALQAQSPSSASAFDVRPALKDWSTGLAMLEAAVKSRVEAVATVESKPTPAPSHLPPVAFPPFSISH